MMLRHFWIDYRLAAALKPYQMRKMDTIAKTLPNYRFADFHRAIDIFLQDKTQCTTVNSINHLPLIDFVQGRFHTHVKRTVVPSSKKICAVGHEQNEAYFISQYWTFVDESRSLAGVIRLMDDPHGYQANFTLELALNQPDRLTDVVDELSDLSIKNSIYKNKFLQINIGPAIDDGYSHQANGIEVVFRRPPKIDDDEIIFDPKVRKLIDRNIVSFLHHRDRLSALGLPMQRGILFYGPPGTGKTYTCQYLFNQLQPVTMLTVAGKGLGEVRSICNLARMLQPSVLVLEDVDLIFTSREVNLYSTALGEMMDELDAFKKNDNVLIIMTTNSIERLEKAIKDRPGRIAQCVHFGPPTTDLRREYLSRYLSDFNIQQVCLDHVANITEGASQAFLEELTYRAVQIGAEQNEFQNGKPLCLTNAMFDEAVAEMTNENTKETGQIIGFAPK